MFIDPLYLILITPALLFALYAQAKTMGAFNRYKRVGNSSNLSGAEAAAMMLRDQGLTIVGTPEQALRTRGAVAISTTRSFLGDHYDPRARTLRLSPEVGAGRSLASVGIACHEAGHALQHAQGYAPLALRTALVPVASLGSWLPFPIILIGLIFSILSLVKIGIVLFGALVVFQLVTLPVEFNASSRAKAALGQLGIIRGPAEAAGVASVLSAAAMTYVAALVSSIMTLLYYVILLSNARD